MCLLGLAIAVASEAKEVYLLARIQDGDYRESETGVDLGCLRGISVPIESMLIHIVSFY